MTEYDLGKVVGDDGEAGNGIASITKTGTSGLVDTYTITYDDGTTTTFTVTNGSNASVTIQTSWGSTTSDSKVPSEKLTKDTLDTKITKSSTTGLMKNDGTVMTSGNGSGNYSAGNHTHSGYISTSSTSGLVKNDGTIDTTSYSTFSGSYNDLSNKPTIPSASSTVPSADTTSGSYGSGTSYARSNHTHPKSSLYAESSHTHTVSNITDFPSIPSSSSDLSDGSNIVKKSSTSGLLKNDGSIDTNTYLTSSAISGMLTSSDIADNLTTNDSTKVLSAKQGYQLNQLIGQAIAYINQ